MVHLCGLDGLIRVWGDVGGEERTRRRGHDSRKTFSGVEVVRCWFWVSRLAPGWVWNHRSVAG